MMSKQSVLGPPNILRPKSMQTLVASSDSKIFSARHVETKENDEPNVCSSCPPKQEVFIDDQVLRLAATIVLVKP